MRAEAKPGAVVLYDYSAGLIGPMFADVYVTHSGINLSTDIWDFVDIVREVRDDTSPWPDDYLDEYLARSNYGHEATRSFPPLFWDGYSDQQQLAFLDRLRVSHLAFSAGRHPHILALIERHPGRFRQITATEPDAAEGTYYLFEVVGAKPEDSSQ